VSVGRKVSPQANPSRQLWLSNIGEFKNALERAVVSSAANRLNLNVSFTSAPLANTASAEQK